MRCFEERVWKNRIHRHLVLSGVVLGIQFPDFHEMGACVCRIGFCFSNDLYIASRIIWNIYLSSGLLLVKTWPQVGPICWLPINARGWRSYRALRAILSLRLCLMLLFKLLKETNSRSKRGRLIHNRSMIKCPLPLSKIKSVTKIHYFCVPRFITRITPH